MILIADKILDGGADQESFGGIDAQVRRNAFGRQVDSFETDLSFAGISGAAFRAVFIRAPWVESVGTQVEVLASFNGHPVAIRQGHLLATSFHPELTGDNRIHRFFVDQLCKESSKAGI
jgi:5'-phosphate synthase pdxT subunit